MKYLHVQWTFKEQTVHEIDETFGGALPLTEHCKEFVSNYILATYSGYYYFNKDTKEVWLDTGIGNHRINLLNWCVSDKPELE